MVFLYNHFCTFDIGCKFESHSLLIYRNHGRVFGSLCFLWSCVLSEVETYGYSPHLEVVDV